jgi:hypothetical protein
VLSLTQAPEAAAPAMTMTEVNHHAVTTGIYVRNGWPESVCYSRLFLQCAAANWLVPGARSLQTAVFAGRPSLQLIRSRRWSND